VLKCPEASFFHEEVREALGVLAEHLEEVADHEVRAEEGEAVGICPRINHMKLDEHT
jgi:hypothetical protein